jgi:hypothetical protein
LDARFSELTAYTILLFAALLSWLFALSEGQRIPDKCLANIGPNDTFEFGVNYRACGFCKFAGKHGDREILPHICGLDFAAYDLRGIQLARTQTLAQGAPYCNFRFSRKPAIKLES